MPNLVTQTDLQYRLKLIGKQYRKGHYQSPFLAVEIELISQTFGNVNGRREALSLSLLPFGDIFS